MNNRIVAMVVGSFALSLGLAAGAADAEYKAAKKQEEAAYKTAKADCGKKAGDDKKACLKDAKATHEKNEAANKAKHEMKEAKTPAEKTEAANKQAKETAEADKKAAKK